MEGQRRQISVMGNILRIQDQADWNRAFKKPVEDFTSQLNQLDSELAAQRQAYVPYAAYQAQMSAAANEKLNGILRLAYPELKVNGGDCLGDIPVLH